MSQEPTIISPDILRQNRVPPGQQETDRFPVLHYGPVHHIDATKWKFSITGLVKKERHLSYVEFTKLPTVRVFSDIHCVTTWSRLNNRWRGVSTGVLKTLVDILPKARFVMVHSAGSFTTNLPLTDFFAEDALFALEHDDKPLTSEHGGPMRLVVPRLYFWKSAKWVTGVEFMEKDKRGFWESAGYHNHGDPWKQERYG